MVIGILIFTDLDCPILKICIAQQKRVFSDSDTNIVVRVVSMRFS